LRQKPDVTSLGRTSTLRKRPALQARQTIRPRQRRANGEAWYSPEEVWFVATRSTASAVTSPPRARMAALPATGAGTRCRSPGATAGHPAAHHLKRQIVVLILGRTGERVEVALGLGARLRLPRPLRRTGTRGIGGFLLTLCIRPRPIAARQHHQIAHIDLRHVARLIVLVLILAIFDAALDVHAIALLQIAFDDVRQRGELAVPHHALVPLRLLLLLPIGPGPAPTGGHGKRRHAIATRCRSYLGILAEVSNQHHLVQAAAHSSSWRMSVRVAGMCSTRLAIYHQRSNAGMSISLRITRAPEVPAAGRAHLPRADDSTGCGARPGRNRARNTWHARMHWSRAPRGTVRRHVAPPLPRSPNAAAFCQSPDHGSRAGRRCSRSRLRRARTTRRHNHGWFHRVCTPR